MCALAEQREGMRGEFCTKGRELCGDILTCERALKNWEIEGIL